MRILFINHHGGGFADSIDIREAITVRELFSEQMGKECSPADFLIRVNRQPTTADQVLQPGDRVSITPTKIAGATGATGGAGGVGGR